MRSRIAFCEALHHISTNYHIARLNFERALSGHCIACVKTKVHQHLVDLGSICHDVPQMRIKAELNSHLNTNEMLQEAVVCPTSKFKSRGLRTRTCPRLTPAAAG